MESDSVEHEETEVEEEPNAVDDSPPNSTTSSWDRMSSESLEDKLEKSEKDETAKEEDLSPITKGDTETTAPETHLSENKEEPHVLEPVSTAESSELANEASTAKEVDELTAEVESEKVTPAET